MKWYLLVWKRFAEFNGRSRRKEYWLFTLYNTLIYLAMCILGFALKESALGIAVLALCSVYAVAMIIPTLACGVRRLHDTGRSGWFILIGFIPFIGGIILIIFIALDSEPGSNLYGPNPKLYEPSEAIV